MEQRDRREGTGEKGYLEKNKNKEKKELEWGGRMRHVWEVCDGRCK